METILHFDGYDFNAYFMYHLEFLAPIFGQELLFFVLVFLVFVVFFLRTLCLTQYFFQKVVLRLTFSMSVAETVLQLSPTTKHIMI